METLANLNLDSIFAIKKIYIGLSYVGFRAQEQLEYLYYNRKLILTLSLAFRISIDFKFHRDSIDNIVAYKYCHPITE